MNLIFDFDAVRLHDAPSKHKPMGDGNAATGE